MRLRIAILPFAGGYGSPVVLLGQHLLIGVNRPKGVFFDLGLGAVGEPVRMALRRAAWARSGRLRSVALRENRSHAPGVVSRSTRGSRVV
jgi:hypothetical protein